MSGPKPGSVYQYTISEGEATDAELRGVPRTGKGTLQQNVERDRWTLVLDQDWKPLDQTELALGNTKDVTEMLKSGMLMSTEAAAAAGRRRKTRRTRRKSRARKSRRSRK